LFRFREGEEFNAEIYFEVFRLNLTCMPSDRCRNWIKEDDKGPKIKTCMLYGLRQCFFVVVYKYWNVHASFSGMDFA